MENFKSPVWKYVYSNAFEFLKGNKIAWKELSLFEAQQVLEMFSTMLSEIFKQTSANEMEKQDVACFQELKVLIVFELEKGRHYLQTNLHLLPHNKR